MDRALPAGLGDSRRREFVDLFKPDASYRSNVFREPVLGSDAIRQYWQRRATCARLCRAGTRRRQHRWALNGRWDGLEAGRWAQVAGAADGPLVDEVPRCS